jgi:hypothetical protein
MQADDWNHDRMHWFAIAVVPLVACTAANPAFDLLDGDDDSAASMDGPDEEAGGSSDGEDSAVFDGCGPFVPPAPVALLIDETPICGSYVATGMVEAVTATDIHVRCSSEFDSDCLPDALAVLRIGHGLPPELVVDTSKPMQLHWYTNEDCDFALVRLQAADELRESFVAVGNPAIFQMQLFGYGLEAVMDEPCECSDCCLLPQGRYELALEIEGVRLVLAEGEEADRDVEGQKYRFRNVAANITGDCRKAFHWQSVRL